MKYKSKDIALFAVICLFSFLIFSGIGNLFVPKETSLQQSSYATNTNAQPTEIQKIAVTPPNETTQNVAPTATKTSPSYNVHTAFGQSQASQHTGKIYVGHKDINAYNVPASYITKAKQMFKIFYGHTSHGSQIISGMSAMNSNPYTFNSSGSGGALKLVEASGDLGHTGDLGWAQTTRNFLISNPDTNVVMWSWCGGCSDNTPSGVSAYLNEMSKLEKEYPNVKFIYMTGHLDGSGVEGNLNRVNQQIRDYCSRNNKILYDFADIESYDPSGNEFLSRYATDGCDYRGGNWAREWVSRNPHSIYKLPSEAAHTHPLNGAMKGHAFWVLLAKMVGYRG